MSRVKLAAFDGVNAESMYRPSRERLLCSWVTLTCAPAGRSAVHKRIIISDAKEIKRFIKCAVKTALPCKTADRTAVKDYRNQSEQKSNATVSFGRFD